MKPEEEQEVNEKREYPKGIWLVEEWISFFTTAKK